MRTIKFEVIDLDKKEVIGYESYHQSFGWTHVLMDGKLDEGSRPVHVGVISDTLKNLVRRQQTGLKDKDGRDVYEGDDLDFGYGIYTVEWHNEAGCWALSRPVGSISSYPIIHSDTGARVIGNIYTPRQATEAKPLL